jgi:eukaryotic-like serine/threonine-protein kinase
MGIALHEGEMVAGKYRITRVLGEGGMGVVALACHEALALDVAIKFLTETRSEAARTRFAREGRAAAKLRGVHTAKVFDVGTLPDGTPYLVMEYLRGSDLENVLKSRGPLPLDELMEYMLQVCEGLQEAHTAGIVHRDIKPANLFLCHEPDGRPLIKILDFGISKATFGTQDMSLTSTQAVLGSPLYMSPEQLRATHSADHRSDIWSLGVVMYELLTGKVPFNGSAITELTIKIVQEPPPSILTLRRDLPAPVASIILRCLAKDPSERFASAFDLAVALEPFARQTAKRTHSARALRPGGTTDQAPPFRSTQSAAVSVIDPTSLTGTPGQGSKRWLFALPLVLVGALATVAFFAWPKKTHQGHAGPIDTLPSARVELPPLTATPTALPPASDIPSGPQALPTGRITVEQQGRSQPPTSATHARVGPSAGASTRPGLGNPVKPPKPAPGDLPGDRN